MTPDGLKALLRIHGQLVCKYQHQLDQTTLGRIIAADWYRPAIGWLEDKIIEEYKRAIEDAMYVVARKFGRV